MIQIKKLKFFFNFKQDKETPNLENAEVLREGDLVEEFVPEAGLAKNRMKQYLETATSQKSAQSAQISSNNTNGETSEQLPEKGTARSLLAKWKSIENLKDKETSPEANGVAQITNNNKQGSPVNNTVSDIDNLPSGIARNLLNKWQNIERDERSDRTSPPNNSNGEELVEKGFAKNVLAKYENFILFFLFCFIQDQKIFIQNIITRT